MRLCFVNFISSFIFDWKLKRKAFDMELSIKSSGDTTYRRKKQKKHHLIPHVMVNCQTLGWDGGEDDRVVCEGWTCGGGKYGNFYLCLQKKDR